MTESQGTVQKPGSCDSCILHGTPSTEEINLKWRAGLLLWFSGAWFG